MRFLLVCALALVLPATAAAAQPRSVKPDRAALDKLLDAYIPAAVAQKNLQLGWDLSAGYARTVSHAAWMRGDTSVQRYPAKGHAFHGYVVTYSYPGDVGFDILLQPTVRSLGAWSFRGEAQKIHGAWRITTFYPVATFAPPGRTQTVLGPNDLGSADSAAAGSGQEKGRLGSWVLALPIAGIGAVALLAIGFAGSRAARRRGRIRAIERSLAADRQLAG